MKYSSQSSETSCDALVENNFLHNEEIKQNTFYRYVSGNLKWLNTESVFICSHQVVSAKRNFWLIFFTATTQCQNITNHPLYSKGKYCL